MYNRDFCRIYQHQNIIIDNIPWPIWGTCCLRNAQHCSQFFCLLLMMSVVSRTHSSNARLWLFSLFSLLNTIFVLWFNSTGPSVIYLLCAMIRSMTFCLTYQIRICVVAQLGMRSRMRLSCPNVRQPTHLLNLFIRSMDCALQFLDFKNGFWFSPKHSPFLTLSIPLWFVEYIGDETWFQLLRLWWERAADASRSLAQCNGTQ